MWILTREVNAYDQEGEYFVAAFLHKPTYADLVEVFKQIDKDKVRARFENREFLEHLLRGGGRRDVEWEWYFLKEYSEGQVLYEEGYY